VTPEPGSDPSGARPAGGGPGGSDGPGDRGLPVGKGPGRGFPGGLCPRCPHARAITSDRGSVFLRCELSRTDPRFPRYPAQPRMVCAGHPG